MAAHGPHPKIREAGLADGCERCGEMAADPLVHLDSDNLRELVRRTRAWMRDQEFPRSENELTAMRGMERLLWQMACISRVEGG